jgi:intermembrane space import and assembly protein 40
VEKKSAKAVDVESKETAHKEERQEAPSGGGDDEAAKNTPYDEQDEKKEDGEEEEEEETCGFCIYMKGGGCKDAFNVSYYSF